MSSYGKTLTVEAKANTHLTHLEELVLTQGAAGYDLAKSFLFELIENLGGNSNAKVSTSVKWDGAPAIFAGVNPDNGKFFVGTKSIFNKEPKLNYTKDDINKNHGHAPGLVDKLSRALDYLPQLGIKNILQGDFMFDDSMLKVTDIDGEPHYTFKPNTIRYAVPVDSKLGEKISNAKFGIVFHTTYDNLQSGASFGADVSNLRRSPEIWFDDAFFKDDTGVVTLTTDEEAEILDLIKKADSININYEDLPSELLNTYINSEIRQGQFLDNSLKSFENFKNWYQSKIDKKVNTLKTEKGQQRARERGQKQISLFDSRSEDIINLFDISRLLFEAKNIFITKYNNAVYNTKHFIDDGSGNLKVTNPEGYVAVDHIGNGVKFVDRLEFSRANFAMDKGFTKESLNISESFTVVFGSEHKITKPINEWLLELKSPEGTFISINEKKVASNSAEVYDLIMSGAPITSFLKKPEYVKPAIAGAIQYHINRQYLKEFSINPVADSDAPENEKKRNQIIALFPGAFRPPTKGHLSAATKLMNQSDIMKILISNPKSEASKRRVGTKEITPEVSKKIWELYGIPPEDVQITDSPSPVRAVFEFLEDPMLAPPGTTIMLGCSTKGGDEARWDNAAAYAKKVRGDEIKVVTSACPPERHADDYEELLNALEDFVRNKLPSIQKEKDPMNIHGSDMRHLATVALEGNQELTNLFKHFLPFNVDHEEVLKTLSSGPIKEVRESFSLPFLYTLVEEVLSEVYTTQDCEKKDGSDGNCEVKFGDGHTACYDNCGVAKKATSGELQEEEEELEEECAMSTGAVAGYSGGKKRAPKGIIRQENKNYKLFTTIEEKGSIYMTNREDILAEQLLREIVRKAIRKTQKKVLKEEQMLRRAVRSLLKEETAKQTIYPYTSLNVLSEFIKNQVYKPTSNFKAAYMTLSSNKEDRERFLQHILDLAKEDMSRMDMNLEPLLDPGKELKAKETELDTAEEEMVDGDGPIVVTMDDLDAKGGVLGDEEELAPGEEELQEEDDEVFSSNTEVERDAVRNFANETYKGFGAALRRFYERVPDNVIKVNVEGREQNIAERELFAIYLEKNLIAHASMAEQYMDSESNLTTDVPSAESDENDLGFGEEGFEEELDLDF